ncbi:MAG: ParB N-terminal domain-containing protein [Thermoplasmata archaeon]|nr:ParB N-terminal domain-containing protein [Thermoplasmata archaeon]
MTEPKFQLVPIHALHIHEEIDPSTVREVTVSIRTEGVVREPILVAEGSLVVLNGHHRVAALRELGVARVPAWVVPYEDPRIRLERWSPGPELTKAEVVQRAQANDPFPPKTTRHRVDLELPTRPTPLAKLFAHPVPGGSRGGGTTRALARSAARALPEQTRSR